MFALQDRCHRIGQTREVHIYRFVSSNTIEENILRKSDQKRQLDWLAIQSGGFNTEMLAKLNLGACRMLQNSADRSMGDWGPVRLHRISYNQVIAPCAAYFA